MRRLGVRNQVLAIEVVDRREIEFPDVGDMLIRDPETDFERYVNTGDPDARARMDAASAAQRERIRIALRRAGVGHIQLRTDRDWVQDIARFVLAYRRVASMLHAPPQGVDQVIVRCMLPQLAFLSPDRLLILLVIPVLVLGLHLRDPAEEPARDALHQHLDARRGGAQAVAVAPPPRRRPVAAQPDHPDRGVRPAEDPGRRAPGASHRGAGHRRVAVHAGHRRASRPGSTRPSRRRSSSCGRCRRSTTCPSSRWPARPRSWSRRPPPTTRSRTRSTASSCRTPPPSARASPPRCARCSRRPRIPTTPTPWPPARSCCSATGRTPPDAAPLQAAGRGQGGQGADLHHRVRHRERLRRPGRQA